MYKMIFLLNFLLFLFFFFFFISRHRHPLADSETVLCHATYIIPIPKDSQRTGNYSSLVSNIHSNGSVYDSQGSHSCSGVFLCMVLSSIIFQHTKTSDIVGFQHHSYKLQKCCYSTPQPRELKHKEAVSPQIPRLPQHHIWQLPLWLSC